MGQDCSDSVQCSCVKKSAPTRPSCARGSTTAGLIHARSTRTCATSMARDGEDRSTCSPQASHASLTLWRGDARGSRTSAMGGMTRGAFLGNVRRRCACSRTSPACSPCRACETFSKSLPSSGMMRAGSLWALERSAPTMSASASGFSPGARVVARDESRSQSLLSSPTLVQPDHPYYWNYE